MNNCVSWQRTTVTHERAGKTLQPTALVHELWLRVTGADSVKWDGRAHFFAAAALGISTPAAKRH